MCCLPLTSDLGKTWHSLSKSASLQFLKNISRNVRMCMWCSILLTFCSTWNISLETEAWVPEEHLHLLKESHQHLSLYIKSQTETIVISIFLSVLKVELRTSCSPVEPTFGSGLKDTVPSSSVKLWSNKFAVSLFGPARQCHHGDSRKNLKIFN